MKSKEMKSFESRMFDAQKTLQLGDSAMPIVHFNDALTLAKEADKLVKPPCEWSYDEDTCSWDASCGGKQLFGEGDIKENHYTFCPYCGGQIEETKHVSD